VVIDEGRKRVLWSVWHAAALQRAKTLPELSSLMGIAPKVQTDEELWAAVTQWMGVHNANYQRLKAAGVE
jgi:hypothetical protein